MRQEELIITFYKIHKCGYYIGNDRKFGSIEDTLFQLQEWAKKASLFTDTAILPKTDEIGASFDLRNTYFYEIAETNSDNFLLTLWNELPDVEGEVATLSKAKKIGDSTKCEIKTLADDVIPGTASYFWFLPKIGYYATVCKKGRTSNNSEMIAYIREFLETYTSYCIKRMNENGEIEILGYKENENKPHEKNISPYFHASRAEDKEEINFINENRTKIRKLVRKESIEYSSNIRLNVMKNLLIHMGVKKPVTKTEKIKIKYEIDYSPSEEELFQLINNWETEKTDKYDDTGFQFQGDESGKTHWLSGSISRIKKDFSIDYYDDEVINPKILLEVLNNNQSDLIKVLKLK